MGWSVDPRDLVEEIYDNDFSAWLRDISLQGLTGVVQKTPVDTGRARGAWLVAINSSPIGEGSYDKAGGATINAGGAVISGAHIGDVVVIENNVDYGVLLEQGPLKYSQFKSGAAAPARMVDRTLQQLANTFGDGE